MKSSQLEISRPMVLFHKNPSFRDRSSQAIACYHETKQDGRTNRNDRNVEAKLHLQNKQHLGLLKNSIPPNPLVHHGFSRMQLWRDIYNNFSDQHHFSCLIVLDRARSPAVIQCIGSSKRFCTCTIFRRWEGTLAMDQMYWCCDVDVASMSSMDLSFSCKHLLKYL
jgi:hypothetical protein